MRLFFFASLLVVAVLAATPVLADEPPPPIPNNWPCVSPDGARIAFVSARYDGRNDVFVINVDGRGERRISHQGGRMPRWSRDGSEILFSGEGADSAQLFSLPLDARTPRLVTTVAGRSPVLSPDGAGVLFSRGSWKATELVVVSHDGSEMMRIAGGRVHGRASTAWNGAWSPDGKRIAYTFGDSTRVLQVHVINTDGTGDRAVTSLTAQYGSAQVPSWSPDGTRLAFQSDRTGSMQVWVMNEDGSNPRQVTGK